MNVASKICGQNINSTFYIVLCSIWINTPNARDRNTVKCDFSLVACYLMVLFFIVCFSTIFEHWIGWCTLLYPQHVPFVAVEIDVQTKSAFDSFVMNRVSALKRAFDSQNNWNWHLTNFSLECKYDLLGRCLSLCALECISASLSTCDVGFEFQSLFVWQFRISFFFLSFFLNRLNWKMLRGWNGSILMPLYHHKFHCKSREKSSRFLCWWYSEMCAHNSTKLIHRQVNTHFFVMAFILYLLHSSTSRSLSPPFHLSHKQLNLLPKVLHTKDIKLCEFVE